MSFHPRQGLWEFTHLADVNKATHEVLVAERVDGVLSLLACSVFNNSVQRVSFFCDEIDGYHCDDSPAPLHNQDIAPYPLTTDPQNLPRKARYLAVTLVTLLIPLSRSRTSAKRTSPAAEGIRMHVIFGLRML